MSDPAPENIIPEEELRAGFKSGHKDMEDFIKNIDNEEYSKTLHIDELLAKHLVRSWQFKNFYTSQMKDGEETGDVIGEIARLKAALKKAREDTEEHAKVLPFKNQWETLPKIQISAHEPPSSTNRSEVSADLFVPSADLAHIQGRSSTRLSGVMFAEFGVKETSQEESQQSFESGPEDLEKIAMQTGANFRQTFDIDELLAKHLILQQEIQTLWTRHSVYRGSFQTRAETVEVEEKFAQWKAELKAAREEIEERKREIKLLAHWKTLAIMHKRGCKPPSGALSVENTMRLTAENSDSETGPLEGLTGSTASKPLDETTIFFSGASGAED